MKYVFLIVTMVLCATLNAQQDSLGVIKGLVTDYKGTPITDAVVVITDSLGNNKGLVFSNKDGSFKVELAVNTYIVTVINLGMSAEKYVNVAVRPGLDSVIDVKLQCSIIKPIYDPIPYDPHDTDNPSSTIYTRDDIIHMAAPR